MDWTAREGRYQAEYRGEGPDDAPGPDRELDPEAIAQDVVDAAFDEAYATLDDEPAHPAALDFNLRGEAILVRRIAEAIAAARRAA